MSSGAPTAGSASCGTSALSGLHIGRQIRQTVHTRKKGNTLLSKASPLNLPQSFCMIATYATPSRRDVQHRESLFLAEQARWMRRSNCHRRSWEVLAKSWLWPWIWRCWRSWPWSPGLHQSVATTSADAHAWNNATHKNRGCPPLGRNPLAKLRPRKASVFCCKVSLAQFWHPGRCAMTQHRFIANQP